jgi:hypothetical protein
VILIGMWFVGFACGIAVFVDRFEAGSVQVCTPPACTYT